MSWRAVLSDKKGLYQFMSLNVFIPQTAAPNPVSFSETTGSSSPGTSSPSAARVRKSFSAVLRTIRQEQGRDFSHRSDGRQPMHASDSGVPAGRAKQPGDGPAQPQKSEARPAERAEVGSLDRDTKELAGVPGMDVESPALRDHVQSDPQGTLLVFTQTPIPPPSVTQPAAVDPDSPEGIPLSAIEHDEAAELASLTSVLPLAAVNHLPPAHAANQAFLVPAGQSTSVPYQDGQTPAARAIAAEPLFQRHETQSALDGAGDGSTELRGDVRPVPLQQGQSLPLQQAGPEYDQNFESSHEMPTQDDASSRLIPDSVHPSEDMKQGRAAREIFQASVQSLSQKEEQDTKPISALPHDQQTIANSTRQSDMQWSEQGGREDAEREHPLAHRMGAPAGSVSETVGEVGTAGAAALSMSRPAESSAAPFAAPASPLTAPRDTGESSLPVTTRSVVFEVAQPDLGRINVRVAMANEMVHTHLSSDRAEVGQFLINGQERLQAALQANGLDMGQFRVDIDRQNAGRSFQQGQPQEQGRTWNQGLPQREGDHASEPYDGRRSRPQGMLNLVA